MQEVWDAPRADTARFLRLAVGAVVGAALLSGAFWFMAVVAKPVAKVAEDEGPVDVTLVSTPEEKPPPDPIPEAAPPPPDPHAAAAPPGPASIYDTDKAPDKLPTPGTPGAPQGGDPYKDSNGGNGSGLPGGTGTAPAPPPPVAPPPPPKPAGPMRVDENVTPPEAISMPAPGYPEAAKSAGIEGTVVVKYVVSESGSVVSAEVLRGPAELGAACVATVKTWKFKPAIFDGHPVSVIRQAKFPFHIKT